MKNVKLVSIAILIAVALVNNVNADVPKVNLTKNIIKLTFVQAIQSPGLVAAMYQQLSGGFLGGPGNDYLTFRVYYQNHFYLITGTVEQWEWFFRKKGVTKKVTEPHD